MTGLSPFLLEKTDNFERTFKRLGKSKAYDKNFPNTIAAILKGLMNEVYPVSSRDEPLPGGLDIPKEWTFHKLEIKMAQGASGQVRLIYLVNEGKRIIRPLWLYSHEQFRKRPPDKELRSTIMNIFE
jgi:hypothetical protein